MTEADEFEVGSVFNSGSKKQNLSHLLNFQYEQRGIRNPRNARNKHDSKNHHRQVGPRRPKYNKELYLQAKYVTKIVFLVSV